MLPHSVLQFKVEVRYSHLILCTGSNGPFPGKCNIVDSYRNAIEKYEDFVQEIQAADSVLVIGGGATGVEMAAEIRTEYPNKEVILVHPHDALADSELLPSVREEARQVLLKKGVKLFLGEKVSNLNELELNRTQKGRVIKTDKDQQFTVDLIICCAGNRINSDAYRSSFGGSLAQNEALKVNKHLQVEGFDNIYAVGDCANVNEPKMAYHAGLHARVAVTNIINSLVGKALTTYNTGNVTMLLAMGRNDGVGQFNGYKLPRFLVAKGKSEGLMLWKSWKEMEQKAPSYKSEEEAASSAAPEGVDGGSLHRRSIYLGQTSLDTRLELSIGQPLCVTVFIWRSPTGMHQLRVCEEPELVERERPRPQGSSPVEEFPIEKQAEEDISDLVHKSGSNKKGRKGGFGSLFDKRTSDKMNDAEDMQSGESEIIVKTVKEACVEGLVVTGGGKEGIFIKEVKVDSPAFEHLSVKEGDQILSATVYFDNVSYEDALQILDHAQPYKMEFCLRRKVELTTPENAKMKHPKEKDQGSPTMRNQKKMKKQQERISWPKFPSFGKGPRVQFKRSHSTSEAEEHRKLEISPPTSDTDSPIKSPLKGPDGKDKKKKHKVQLKMKMKGHRSKSVEESQSSENELVWENQQVEGILEEKIPEGHEEKMQEILQVLDEAENMISFKTGNDEAFQSFSGKEMHETHLISLGNTLKTTDISVALSETAKIEGSEMKVRIDQKDKLDIGAENQAESTKTLHTILDPSSFGNVALTQQEIEIGKLDSKVHKQEIDGSENKVESRNAELEMPNLDICVGVAKTSPMIDSERQLKEKSVFENESYGIRTRGPLADMATSKSHFVNTVNGLQFMSSDFSEIMQVGKISEGISKSVVFQQKPSSTDFAVEDTILVKSSKLPSEATASEFKLPKVDLSGLVTHELISMTEAEKNRTNLPKREDIEIPGMEVKETKPILKTPKIKVQKTEKILNITKDKETEEEFNVEDVKVAVSKFPAFKLPEGDITGVLVQKEIELKSTLSPRGSPHKISITSTDSTIIPVSNIGMDTASDAADKNTVIKMPKVEPPYIDGQISTDVMNIDYTQSQLTEYERFGDLNFKLPKREDIEIPGMEAIKETKLQNTADLNQAERPKTKKHGDKKGHEKKSKKHKINIQELESTKASTSDIGSDLPKLDSSNINTKETKILEKQKFKTPNIEDIKDIEVQIQKTKILEDNMDNMDLPQKTGTKFGKTKFQIPSVTMPDFVTKVPGEAANISTADVQGKKDEHKLPEDKIKLSEKPLLSELNGTDINKDYQPVNVYDRAQDTETEGQGRKFKLPKFEISFPEVKAPRISCASKKDDDSSLSEESGKMPEEQLPEEKLPAVKHADGPDADSQISEMKIKMPGFSLPRFGTSKTEPVVPAADVTLTNAAMSSPEGHTKTDDPNTMKDKDATKFSSPTKFKIPSIRFPHFGVKVAKTAMETSDMEVNVEGPEIRLPDTELKLPEESISVYTKESDIDKQKESANMELINIDIQSEAQGSKFKLPKIGVGLPEVKGPKINISTGIDISKPDTKVQAPYIEMQSVTPKVNVDVIGPELSLPDADMKISTEPLSVDINRPDADKESLKMKDQDIQMKEKDTRFKFPKSEISFPEVKGPKVDVILDKGDIDLSIPKAKVKIQPSDVEGQDVTAKVKANLPEVDSTDIEIKKTQGFLFPKIEFHKSEVKAPEGDASLPNVDVALPEGSIEIEKTSTDAQQKSQSKFGSPTKFKLPTINFPKFGTKGPKASVEVSGVDVGVKSDAESQPVNIKSPDADKDIQMKEKGSKFKLPRFGISLPEFKEPKLDVNLKKIDSDGEKAEGVTSEVKADLSEVDSKTIEMKIKSPGFSFPNIGFGKSEVKDSEGNVGSTSVDVSLPEGSIEIERPATDVTLPMEDADQKVQPKFGSPTKFKLPSFNFPTFGTKGPKASIEFPDVNVDVKGPEITLPDAQMKLSDKPLSVDIKGPGLAKEMKSPWSEMKDQDIQMEDFGVSLPEVKEPEIDISMPTAKVHVPDAELQGVTAELKADLPGVGSKDIELKMKTPVVSSTKIGFSQSEFIAPKGDVSLSTVNEFLPKEGIDMERPSTDITISLQDAGQKDSTKFKLPSISFPKFGTKGPKASVKVPDVEVDVKGHEISQDAEMTLPAELLSVDIKGPDVDNEMKLYNVELKEQNIQMKEQDSKSKFSKFGISLPEVKGPKIDIRSDKEETLISLPEAILVMPSPNVQGVKAEIKADVPEVDSKNYELKMKTSGFSVPKIDFSKSEVKASEDNVSLTNVMSLPKGSIEIERPSIDVSLPTEDAEQISQSTYSSPTKFKLPSISLPKFATKGPKSSVEVSDVDGDVKGAEITLTDAEIKLSAKPVSVEIKGSEVDKEIKPPSGEIKDTYIQIKEKESKFKLPKFGISLPDVKGPKVDVSLDKVDSDIVVQKAKLEVHPPDAEIQGITSEMKADLPEVDSKDIEVKMKKPVFSFPKFGFSKSDDKDAKDDASSLNVNLSLPEGSVEIDTPSTDVTIPIKNTEQKGQSKFGSPTKFKLPSISFPKFGSKGPKASVEFSNMDVDITGPGIVVPDAEKKLPAEALSVNIKGPDAEKEIKPICVEMKDQNVQIKKQVTEPKLLKFDISLPEVKGPKIHVSSDKPEMDISIPKAKIHTPDAEVPGKTAELKVDLPEDIELKMKMPEQKDSTMFKMPSISFPKFGTKATKASVAIPDVDVDVKGPTITLPDAEMNLSAEPFSVDIEGSKIKPIKVEIKEQNIQLKDQESKFKLPNFGISLPEVKGPKIDVSSDKAEIGVSVPEAHLEVAPPNVKLQGVAVEVKAVVPEVDSKKSIEIEGPSTDASLLMQAGEPKSRSKFGSPTKFKLPSINFPKFGTKSPKASVEVSDMDVDVKGPKITLPDAEIKVSAEPLSVDIKGPDVQKEMNPPNVQIKDEDIQIKEKGSKFKLPKYDISLSGVKGPNVDASFDKVDSDISVPKAEIHPPDAEVQEVTVDMKSSFPKVGSEGLEMRIKTPGFSFPKIGFSKSEVKASEGCVSLPNVDVPLTEESLDMEKPSNDVTISLEDSEQKDPTKFRLPSISFPKFGSKGPKAPVEVSDVDVDVDVKGPDISLPVAKMTLPSELLSVDIKMPDAEKETKPLDVEIKDQNIQMKEQGSKFKLPKFGISLPDVKRPKIDKAEIDISIPETNLEMHQPYVKVQGVTAEIKAGLPEVNSKDLQMKMETPDSSLDKTEFSKSNVKTFEGDVSLPNVDIALPEGSIENKIPSTDVSITMENAEQKSRSKFTSPTKFKLPSVNFPKFGTKGPKASVSDVDVDAKGPEITVSDAEIKLSADTISMYIKEPDLDTESKPTNVEIKDEDMQMKEQSNKFRLPKFEIGLPEIKGPKVDVSLDKMNRDISVPDAKVEVHPPDAEVHCVTDEIKAHLPEVDSKDFELKINKPGLSFPKIGFGKSEVKPPEGDANFQNVDVAVSEESVEIKIPDTNVTISDTEHKVESKFGSPTKFKLPSINFPKFGTKGPKASVEVSDVDKDIKKPEITLPDAKIKLSAEPLLVDMKGPVVDREIKPAMVEIKDQEIPMKEQASKFKLPKFGISLPEVKGPKIDRSKDKAEINISAAKAEVHPTDVEVQGVTAEIKVEPTEVDSKNIEINVDMSLPKGGTEIEKPSTDLSLEMKDTEQKSRTKFGSPTKFKLPSINLPMFGTKSSKSSAKIQDVDVKGPEINLPDADMKLSADPLKVDIKEPGVEKEITPPSVEMKDQDIQIKEQGGKFKLPKFEISLPEIKAPTLDVRLDKTETDISVSKANVEGLPDAEMHKLTDKIKVDLPEVNSKDTDVKMSTPGFSIPGTGFRKPEGEGDVTHPNVDVCLPEGSIEIDKAATDLTSPMEDAGQKDQSKFGSPRKFKLPSINFPKFGTKGPKASVDESDADVDVKEPQISLPDTELKLSVEPIKVDKEVNKEKEIISQDIQTKDRGIKLRLPKFGISIPEVKGPSVEKAEIDISVPKAKLEVHTPDAEVQDVKAEIKADLPVVGSKDTDVKFKEPGLSFPKFSKSDSKANDKVVETELDSQVEKCGDGDAAVNNKSFDVILKPKQKYAKEIKLSHQVLSAKLGDVVSGFDVEFNVPTFDELDETKQKYLDTLKHQLMLSEYISKPEDAEAQEKLKASVQKQTTKDNEAFQFDKKAEHSPTSDIYKNEYKKMFEDIVSPTSLSLSSSDAFADESSAFASEQINLSLASPTVVKVKYFEPAANADVSELHSDIITLTTKSEVISMDPHQPEKVNIPFSSETSSSSVDTLKEMSGHIVVSNVSSVSKTEHAAILTRVDALASEKATHSMSVEETVKGHTIVEKHIVKKSFGEDKEKISLTQKIQLFEGDSFEPIFDDTASSIQKLRDTVHTEKLKFFEGAETSKTVIMSTETILRHADSSTDEHEEK
ncbi:Neuroblast differentiation-associated protein AHNAK [Bagarius yarrelli]|uniref:Neuroblast differentiation-associated protein AHNAK n=1 Tax=Bagarius yarrelli TaxID=175774 RepID=A0A556TN71_BAGYA|nr:Neuroblast differentiation-associated protein AHNAK [Bagarius yarrelli]